MAFVQSLSSLILVTRGNRMEIPSAVWVVEWVNSAPVISQIGAACMSTCVSTSVSASVCACVWACVCMCVRVCVCMCMSMCVCEQLRISGNQLVWPNIIKRCTIGVQPCTLQAFSSFFSLCWQLRIHRSRRPAKSGEGLLLFITWMASGGCGGGGGGGGGGEWGPTTNTLDTGREKLCRALTSR